MKPKTDRNKQLVKDRNDGLTFMQLAIKYGLSSATYAQLLYKRWKDRL